MAKLIYTYTRPSVKKDLEAACHAMNNDGVIAYPSDVNWAFACDPKSGKALERILQLKPSHPKDQPFSLICADLSMVAEYAHMDSFAYRLMRKILPGPYTIILERSKNLPKQIKDKRKKVGVRIPASDFVIDLVKEFQRPLATASIPQIKGGVEHGSQVEEYFGHALALILDLGQVVPGNETTILDLSEGEVKVLREGMGPTDALLSTARP